MKQYIEFDKITGKIIRTGRHSDETFHHLLSRKNRDVCIIEGQADDVIQKIEFDGFDENGKPVNPRIVDKTPAEIEVKKTPKPVGIPDKQRQMSITKKQWQDVLDRIEKLEKIK